MNKNYKRLNMRWGRLLALLGLLLSGAFAQAQSGPVGNEWIVPGQQYYKIKISKDGLYKLNYQYLTQAGISGVAPSQLQIWRRGRELARYVGGNTAVLDPTTFLEFYAVRNDGKLDRELYRNPQDQGHQYYSLYTDTAAYFITWSVGSAARPGRSMAQPTAIAGVPHPHRLVTQVNIKKQKAFDDPPQQYVYQPWLEAGEGYYGYAIQNDGSFGYAPSDSLIRAVAPTGPAPSVEVLAFGAKPGNHATQVIAINNSTQRILGTVQWAGMQRARQTFALLRSDINSAGQIYVGNIGSPLSPPGDNYYIGYFKITAPQLNRWFSNRRSVTFLNDSLLAGPATYEYANDSIPATAVGFDVQDIYNVQRIVSTPGSANTRRYVFPNANASATHRLVLADEAYLAVPPPARRVVFRTIAPAAPNFIIITHPLLMKPDPATPGVTNAAQEYANYRASAAGGGYNVLMVTAPELYDQFTYGDRSWLALRHFSRWMVAAAPNATNRYLLLLGKGIQLSDGLSFRLNGEQGFDLVPASSRSVSDNMITADIDNNNWQAKLHTGRLTVTTPHQIISYLDKLKYHEVTLGQTPAPWRKNVLHLIGGKTPQEIADFRTYMDAVKVRVERPLLGGHVDTESRVTPNNLPVSINISAQLNAGLSLITYFGHGSPSAFTLNFGAPSTSGYNNTGRYPVLFLNGCASNNTFSNSYTVVEDWLFAEQKGALGSLGESGFSFEEELNAAQDTLYKILFNEPAWFGKPITVAHDEAVRRLSPSALFLNSTIGTEQLLCTGWQGDPALALFAPAQPDFVANSASISITPSAGQTSVKADSPDFSLSVGVANPGRITYEPVQIQVTRIFPSGSGIPNQVYPLLTFRQSWRPDTTYVFTLPNNTSPLASGTSTFRVVIDPNNQVAESNESNNTAQIDFSFLRGGVSVLRPTEFAIVSTATPQLAVQSNDPQGTTRVYEFELDTAATFNSGLRRSATVTAGVVAQWTPAALPTTLTSAQGVRDSIVWYWRARFQTPVSGEDGNWVTSSFRLIPSSPGGWSQSHYAQFKRDARTGVDVSAPNGNWSFVNTRVPIVLRTKGGGVPGTAAGFSSVTGGGIYIQSAAGLPSVSGCGVQSPNLLIAVYNGASLRPVAISGFQRCGQAPDYFYYFSASDPIYPAQLDPLDNLNTSAARQGMLNAFLTAIPDGSYVAVVSTNRLTYSTLPAALKARIQTLLGSQLITTLADGEPLTLLGQKLTATTGRLIHEKGPDRSSATTIPTVGQTVELRDTLQRPSSAGRIVSTRIGPSQQWLNLYHTIRNPLVNGQRTLSVVAIDTLGRETVVLPNVAATTARTGQVLTQAVPARTYPYIRLELAVADTVTRIPPQLRQWLVTSRGLPEGVVRRDAIAASNYAAATLARMAADSGYVRFPVRFDNISDEAFARPIQTRVNLRNVSTRTVVATALITSPGLLGVGGNITIPVRLDVRDKFGTFAVEVVVNPRLQPEQNYSNNELTLEQFTVVDTNVPPTLDVAFDGRHILNGELVSAQPVINIQLSDESRLTHITNPSAFTVSLRKPGQTGLPTMVNLNGSEVRFSVDSTKGSVARLIYEPAKSGPLPDGVYELHVQGRDPRNASAGTQDFQVKFEVVNSSQISNVYPYPNPIVSKARFVFTLTGQTLPTNMKIQIITLTGRVVREIFMSELGPLHIGNNITDFAWDGTDTYGDRLANGTYLYRVALDDASSQFGRRETAGDKAFKNDWGKLVLMR